MIRSSEYRTEPFYLGTSLSFRCYGSLNRVLFILLKESQCHAEKPNLITQYLGIVCDFADFMARSFYWYRRPNSVKICPCVVLPFCCQHWRLFSRGFSFKIYVCEKRATESGIRVLHLFCLAAVSAQGVESQATALGRRSIDVCKSCSNEHWWQKKRHQKHEAIKWGLGKRYSSFWRAKYVCVPSLLWQV